MAQLKYHFDALERLDANLNAFFSQQLQQVRPQLFAKKYPQLKGRTFLPIKNDINLGAQVYVYRTIDEAGEARPVGEMGDDAQAVELKGGTEDTHKMRGIEIAYSWTIDEARAAIFAGQDLSTRKAMAARKAIERFIDKNMLLGGTVMGAAHQGLFTLSGGQAPTTFTPASTTWEDETPDEIATDLAGIFTKIITDTLETEAGTDLILPTSTDRLIRDRRMGDGSNVTIQQYFQGTHPEVTMATSLYLEAYNAGTGMGDPARSVKRMVAYCKDAEHLEGLVNEFEQLPPEYYSAKVTTLCRARVGGVAAYFPKSVAYGDNI
jgi:hypothetical protein